MKVLEECLKSFDTMEEAKAVFEQALVKYSPLLNGKS